jgi:hypothetical protein
MYRSRTTLLSKTLILTISKMVEGHTDVDWVDSPSNRRSITGYCMFIGVFGSHKKIIKNNNNK